LQIRSCKHIDKETT